MGTIYDTTGQEPAETTVPHWFATYIGIPFEIMNCWQLICQIYTAQFKKFIPNYRDEYDDVMDAGAIQRIIKREMKNPMWRRVDDPVLGDVIAFRISGLAWHTAMVAANGEMIHTMKNMNSCLERYDGKLWKKRRLGFYRYDL